MPAAGLFSAVAGGDRRQQVQGGEQPGPELHGSEDGAADGGRSNESIEQYLIAMDTADREEPEVPALKKGRLQEKIDALKQQMQQLKGSRRR